MFPAKSHLNREKRNSNLTNFLFRVSLLAAAKYFDCVICRCILYLNMLIFWTLLNIKLANPCLFFGWFLVFSNNYLYNFTTGMWWIIMHLVIWCWDSNSWISSITTGPELPPIPELILYTIAKIKNNVSSPLFMKNPNKNLSEKGTAWSSSHHFGCWCQSY